VKEEVDEDLKAAILARPEDDAPRLAYADWLLEHDRAEERPCPYCTEYLDDPENPWRGKPGYRPERDPASGRHEGGWANCYTCNSGGKNYVRAGVVRDGNLGTERAEFIRLGVELARMNPPLVLMARSGDLGWDIGRGEKTFTVAESALWQGVRAGMVVDVETAHGCYQTDLEILLTVYRASSRTVEVTVGPAAPWPHRARLERVRNRQRYLWIARGRDLAGPTRFVPGWLVLLAGGRSPYPAGPLLLVKRGFVEEVRCSLEEFIGAAPALFAAQPVTDVVLTDRGAHWYILDDEDPRIWFAADGGGTAAAGCAPALLPPELFGRLGGKPGLVLFDPYQRTALFNSNRTAERALSLACVEYGRELAGVRPGP
jgi:uncharacterized protein (TIGR02996 family)